MGRGDFAGNKHWGQTIARPSVFGQRANFASVYAFSGIASAGAFRFFVGKEEVGRISGDRRRLNGLLGRLGTANCVRLANETDGTEQAIKLGEVPIANQPVGICAIHQLSLPVLQCQLAVRTFCLAQATLRTAREEKSMLFVGTNTITNQAC